MNASAGDNDTSRGGILIHGANAREVGAAQRGFLGQLEQLGLDRYVQADEAPGYTRVRLRHEFAQEWAPCCDTMRLCEKLGLDTHANASDLEREIFLAMLLGPVPFEYPSYEELQCAVRIRKNIVDGARKTALSFHTTEAERPADYWTYANGRGFTILPGKSLIAALEKATQPEASGTLYSFSCYRATEYVILLGLARELAACNPELYSRLQTYWEARAIMSGEFHEVFLREHGTMSEPLPLKYFVPGDRTWFRNPDDHSSDVTGYEGSWVMYLGGGLFTNFWKRDQPYTLTAKCIEIYHWRNATYRDQAGELRIDEAVVEKRIAETADDPAEAGRILGIMQRHREPGGVYVDGGCIDTTREYLRWVCPGTSDLVIPRVENIS
jgi:hypothetical protein